MKSLTYSKRVSLIFSSLLVIAGLATPSLVIAETATTTPGVSNKTSTTATTTTHALSTTEQQQHLASLQSKGDEEITRRLTQLNKLDGVIATATKLTATDKTSLTSEVNNEITGLTSLKTKLDGETILSAAIADAQSIFSDYRVYALVTPKVWLVKTADDQQVLEAKLSTFAIKLQDRLTAAKVKNKDVTSLQTMLDDMNVQIKNAQSLSSAVEQKVLPLLPSDYNSDHTILSSEITQLKTAHSDNEAAYTDAKNIVSGLKSL